MLAATIPSLAILKVNWDAHRDHIDNFVPFVAECLRTAPQPEVSLPELQEAVSRDFRLIIPQGALRTILKRAAHRGYVERTEGIYRRNDKTLEGLDFSRVRDDVLRQYQSIIIKLVRFAKERYGLQWTPEQADAALLACLERGSVPILAAAVDGRVVPPPEENIPHGDFVASAFAADVSEGDPEGFDFLETVVKGAMLVNVLLFPDLGGVQRQFARVQVYFDTGFLLQALGLEGESRQAVRRELIDLLYEQNAALMVFEHTLYEIRNVLEGASHSLRNPGGLRHAHGDMLQHFIESGYSSSDVELVLARLEKMLRALHLQIKPRPAHTKPLGVDEVKLEKFLREDVGYHRKETLYYDIDSVTAIHRIRQGRLQRQIESCEAIFVTTNTNLARAAARFFQEEYEAGRDSVVPHVILDHIFTTLVWLKKPLAAPDLPRKRMIADCYAAMSPPDHLWKKYLDEIDRLQVLGETSDDDYNLLRFSLAARTSLMELTFGDIQAFTEGTVAEVLAAAQAAARAETEAKLEAQRVATEAADQIAAAEKQRAAAVTARLEAERHAHLAERQAQLDRIMVVSTRMGRWAARAFNCVGVALLALITYCLLLIPDFPGGRLWPLGAAAVLSYGAFLVANGVWGTTMMSLGRKVELRVAHFVEKRLTNLVELPQLPPQ